MNWITAPLRRSTCAQNRFCYSVPTLMPASAIADGSEPGEIAGESGLVAHDEPDAGEAEREPHPLPADDALAEPGARDEHRQDRLQPDQHRAGAGRHAARERHEHAAEVGAMHEPRRYRDVQVFDSRRAATARASRARPPAISSATSAKRQSRNV